MMQPTGPNNLGDLADNWTKIVIRILQTKIARLNIRASGDLFNSLDSSITGSGVSYNIYFNYNIYGKFVDMGVGKNYSQGNSGNVEAKQKQRRRKEWYSRVFYAQVMTLGELARKNYGEQAARNIVSTINAVNDLKSTEYRSRKS
jgi:hypothetical protein